jgi:hypothetical protein
MHTSCSIYFFFLFLKGMMILLLMFGHSAGLLLLRICRSVHRSAFCLISLIFFERPICRLRQYLCLLLLMFLYMLNSSLLLIFGLLLMRLAFYVNIYLSSMSHLLPTRMMTISLLLFSFRSSSHLVTFLKLSLLMVNITS